MAGFKTKVEYRHAWRTFIEEHSSERERNELAEAGLICRSEGVDYYPLPVLVAACLDSPEMTTLNAYQIMARFRRYSADASYLADTVLGYIKRKNLDEDPAAKSFGPLTDPELLEPCPQTVDCLLGHLDRLRRTNLQWFDSFAAEQMEIWRLFTACNSRLKEIRAGVSDANLALRQNDYVTSTKALSVYLNMLADAYKAISEFETYWGIDKLLAPQVLNRDVTFLRRNLRYIRTELHEKLAHFREQYQEKWGVWGLSDAIGYLFSSGSVTSPMRIPFNGLPRDQKRVFAFILDGYGMVQHLWALKASEKYGCRSFSQDIFRWLEGMSEFCGINVLGSAFATDTGSGLAAIFTGNSTRNNGVFSSKMWDPFSHRIVDVLKEGPYALIDRPAACFFADLPDDVKIKVFHGGGRGEIPTPFGKWIYGTRADYMGINIPERIFGVLRKSIADDCRRQLYSIYYPLIDRTGHFVGSFSYFELNEIQRFKNSLLAFLIDLVYYNEELFDSKTTFLFTADHGMFETADRYVTVTQIRDCLNTGDGFLWTNRSVWVYSNRPHEVAERLSRLCNNADIAFEIHFKGDLTIRTHLGDGPNVPDLIIQFTDEGIIAPYEAAKADLLLFGVHGGRSNEEVFIPFISLCLTSELGKKLKDVYKSLEA